MRRNDEGTRNSGQSAQGGNTETILDEVLRGAAEVGAKTEKIVLAEKEVNPCRACNACSQTRVCIQKNDMALMIEPMKASRVWILATPVYWWGARATLET